ncbi:hypothetical protein PY650_24475 [Rhizobium calliandrae]|uniref:Winged helix domain-containing protein n=1 Tax=Rhizobium calliandrae TaxID=1312182 RepID=A0ABT7KL63_9HYPH|nr:hypothetical protein [Rhizobium calliandrae]MDL2408740.1 hypothetical protein [Rhizobium calliandrae]
MSKLKIKVRKVSDGSEMFVHGREAQTMQLLIKNGDQGISSLHHPGIRLSHYIFKLRSYGFLIETVNTPHSGDFPGHHAVYRLKSEVMVLQCDDRRSA